MAESLLKRILVVDDSITINQNIADTLTLEGYEVHMAFDGRQAVDLLMEKEIDLIITDISMPNMNGHELVKFVRTESKNPRTPIIVITADDNKTVELLALQEGANKFLLKPFNDDKLIDFIVSLLAHN